ncbi:WhiB family transcriptional regulator [Bifidobacterium saguini]|nr:WhiB family transcriptional regulator [Bifidobacterium saguini]QTB90711.1 WhiB family transcriptional regulator [Bifidobacterium saguini]
MWGPESLPNAHDQYEMRRAAVKICEACPVKAECLAFGILAGEQSGIYGGLPLRARRVVLRIAREAGLRCDPTDPTAQPRLARYIRSNPEIVVAAREHEAKRHHAELADERRRRWRESKRSAADDPSGKSGSGGE